MLSRFRVGWVVIRDSLWFVPGLLTMLAATSALAITGAERRGLLTVAYSYPWLFGGGVDGAREVLGAIAGSLITVTGVVFSVTIVALQLASSQFTPRILRNFTSDRANQLVLGVFIGTFTYALLVLRTVDAGGDQEEPFVPRVAVTLAVLLVLVSIGFLIFFINHAARSIQVATILDRVTRKALRGVERLFPEELGHSDSQNLPDPWSTRGESRSVPAPRSGYLQTVDDHGLFQLGVRGDVVIAMERPIGEFVLEGEPLATVWSTGRTEAALVANVQAAFVIGPERTPEQDVEFGVIEIADIAVKALSPGINDPTTALHCIDRLSEILLALGNRQPPPAQRTMEGQVHFLARHTTFERVLGLAFDQITYFGASNPQIAQRILDALTRIAALIPQSRRGPLALSAAAVLRARRESVQESETASVREHAS